MNIANPKKIDWNNLGFTYMRLPYNYRCYERW